MNPQTTPSLRASLLQTNRRVAISPGETYTGIVKWYNADKGFGFITPQDDLFDSDIFVHANSLTSVPNRKLEIGQTVRFRVQLGGGKHAHKMQAMDVVLI